MPLKLYTIASTLRSSPDWYGILKDKSLDDEVYEFFKRNRGDENKIKELNLVFQADKGYTLKNIEKTDYIFSFSAPLFSSRFVESIGETLKDEMQFFPCTVVCKGTNLDWYAAKICHYYPIIDKELSTYRTLTDGKTKIVNFVKYRSDIEEKFYIARDDIEPTYVCVSDLFKELCEKNGLLIEFLQLDLLY